MSDDEQHEYDTEYERARKAAYEDAMRTVNGVRVRTRGGRQVAAKWTFPAHTEVDEWGFPQIGASSLPEQQDDQTSTPFADEEDNRP
jgi:hypothetical protein